MNHVVFYSGGVGSFMTAKRVIDQHGKEDVYLLFTDTLTEDPDLYRFIIEGTAKLYGVVGIADLLRLAEKISKHYFGTPERKEAIIHLSEEAKKRFPNLRWTHEGRDIWETFTDVNFLGNSKIAPCTQLLKQRNAKRYIKKNFKAKDTTLYLGIDWTEEHRTKAPRRNWHPFPVEFPLCEEPFLSKEEMIEQLLILGIKTPYLYTIGFTHNNCAGMCVKGGQGHWLDVLEKLPDRFAYAEAQEERLRQQIGKPVSIMTKMRKGDKQPYTLRELRLQYEKEHATEQLDLFDSFDDEDRIDRFDKGGCGCFGEDEIAF